MRDTQVEFYYHVRSDNGVTIDWLTTRDVAIGIAAMESAQVFEVHYASGRATRIY